MTTELPKLTERDTKKTILDAYEKALKFIKQQETGKLNPSAVLEAKETALVVEAVETLTTEGTLEEQIAWLKKNMGNVLDSLSNGVAEQLETYNKVKKAISVQEEKLKELFDIEAEAFALVALVNSKEELAAEYDEKLNARRKEAEEALSNIIKAGQEQRQIIQQQIKEEQEATEKERKREYEEYIYNFKREKRERVDALNDELDKERKALKQVVEAEKQRLEQERVALAKREEAVTEREESIEELVATIQSLKQTMEQEVAQAKEDTARALKTEFSREKEYLQKDAKHQADILQNQVDMLHSNLITVNEKNKELEVKLEKAYAEIRELANKTVDNAGDKKVVSQLERMIAVQQTKQ